MTVPIAQKLHLDVLGAADELLEEDVRAAERVLGLTARLVERLVERVGTFDDPHAAPATAHRRLDDHRIAQRLGHRMRAWARAPRASRCRRGSARRPRVARFRAATLSPSRSSSSGGGPTKTIPAPRRPARTPRSRRGSRIRGEWRQPASPAPARRSPRCPDSCGSARRPCPPGRPHRP